MKLGRLALLLACAALPLAAVKAASVDTVAVETADDGSAKAPEGVKAASLDKAAVETADNGSAKAPEGVVEAESADPPDNPAKPWTLPQPQLFQKYGIHMFGWLDQGFTGNTQSPADRTNGPVALNDRSNDYELNQLWMGLERKVKTDGCGFDLGGRIDMSYGTDWRYGDCVGLEDRINAKSDLYGLVIPQFYLEVGWNDLTVKLGHYAAGMGYEQVPGPANFFYSHSYAIGYSEVILVTGMQAEYKLTDNWSINSGFFDGWSGSAGFEDPADKWDYLGGLKWHNDDNTTSLSWEITAGPQDPAGIQTLYDYALVFKQQLTKSLLYVAQQNDGGEANAIPALEQVCQVVRPGPVPDLHGQSHIVIRTAGRVLPRSGRDAGGGRRQPE